MRMKLLRIVCLLGAAAVVAGAQPRSDEKSAEKAFRDSLANQLLIARDFSAEPEVDYQWTAQGLEAQAPPRLRTLGSIEVGSVKVKGGRVEIRGTRQTLLSKKKDNGTSGSGDLEVSEGSPVGLVIDLGGADPATVLPRLKEALFYANLEEAVAGIPPMYRRILGFRGERSADQPENRAGSRIGSRTGNRAGGAAQRVCPADPSSFTQPRVVHSENPEYSEEARRAKFSGNVLLGLTVDEDGEATDLWIVRPAGYGLDERAAQAVRQYQFNPAMCVGEPVASSLAIEVNFQIWTRGRVN
jgi:TonB family protein